MKKIIAHELVEALDSPEYKEKFRAIVRIYKKSNPELLTKPLAHVWAKIMAVSNCDIEFMKTCGLVPQKGSKIIIQSLYRSTLEVDKTDISIFKSVASMVKDKKLVLEEMERYVFEQYSRVPIINEAIRELDPFYRSLNPDNPAKFRYMCLVSQIKFFNTFGATKLLTEYKSFEGLVGNNLKDMLGICPQMVKKSLKIKLRDNSYQEYVQKLMYYMELEKKLPEKNDNVKKVKI